MGDQGHHCIEFKIATEAAQGDGRIVSNHLGAYLNQGFWNDGVNLSRHHGGTGLSFRKVNLPDPATGTGSQPTDIVGNFEETDGHGFQGPAHPYSTIPSPLSLKGTGWLTEASMALLVDDRDGLFRKPRVGIGSCPDRSPAEGKFIKGLHSLLNPIDAEFHLLSITLKLLTQPDGDGVLEMGSANFENGVKLLSFGFECLMKTSEGRKKFFPEKLDGGDMDGRREDIVTGLT